MKYSYTTFEKEVPGLPPTRLDVTTNLDEITESNVTGERYVEVTDNLTMKGAVVLNSVDDLEGWRAAQERAGAWRPRMKEKALESKPGTAEFGAYLREKLALIDTNLKTAAAVGKPRVSDVPPAAFYAMGAAMSDGARKYGRFNWRSTEVTASVFYDAMRRHLDDWYAGQDHASDSGIHHLAHMMAGGAIILDAIATNVFKDDRDNKGPLATDQTTWKVI